MCVIRYRLLPEEEKDGMFVTLYNEYNPLCHSLSLHLTLALVARRTMDNSWWISTNVPLSLALGADKPSVLCGVDWEPES